jgi:hypothetical protein
LLIEKFTKRSILSFIARTFDPMGMLSAVIIKGKLIMQLICMSGVDWEDSFPKEIEEKDREWIKACQYVNEVKVPRCLEQKDLIPGIYMFFQMRRKNAYESVIFLRKITGDEMTSKFIATKVKLHPFKLKASPGWNYWELVLD